MMISMKENIVSKLKDFRRKIYGILSPSYREIKKLQKDSIELNERTQIVEKQIQDINNSLGIVLPIFKMIFRDVNMDTNIVNKSLDDYTKMQKIYYENDDIPSEHIVGQYNWHENFPYETFFTV